MQDHPGEHDNPLPRGGDPSRPCGREWWLVLCLCALQGGLLARTAWDKSDTADEAHYLANAFLQWDRGDLTSNCESPTLPKWGFGLALRIADPQLFDHSVSQGHHPLWSRKLPQTRRNLFAARAATMFVTVAAGVFIFLCARRFGRGGAFAALSLWALSPTVLANGSLATLDAWAAAFVAVTLWAGVRLAERPTLARAAIAGIALGLAAASKVPALGMAPVLLGVLVWALRRDARATAASASPWPRRLVSHGSLLAGAFLMTLWAVYGLRLETLDTRVLCGREVPELAGHVVGPLPFRPWIEGFLAQILHGSKGHRNYLFGEVRSDGWWWFYLATLGLKTTLGTQGLVVVRLLAWLRGGVTRGTWLVEGALLAFPLLLFVVMSAGRTQNGIKYLLPAFPLAAVWGGRVLADAARAFGGAGRAAVAALLVLGACESLAVHPHHLMFFNLWAGGPEGGPRYLIHGDDWGQDQRRLAAWQKQNRPWRLFYTHYSGNPHHWGVNAEEPTCDPRPGYYALHAIELHRPKRYPVGCFDWLTVEEPDERLGYSIYLYLANKPRIARLAAARGRVKPFWVSPAGRDRKDYKDRKGRKEDAKRGEAP